MLPAAAGSSSGMSVDRKANHKIKSRISNITLVNKLYYILK